MADIKGLTITKLSIKSLKDPMSDFSSTQNVQLIYSNPNIYADQGQSLSQFLFNHSFTGTYTFTFLTQSGNYKSFTYNY